ncbi:MAG: 1-acyl-sn-glycerol-3-phosphate acyltransferase, partial [Synechococcaceae cyanobacterium SM2_3_60]|nr:1-acyl-sn-glycerol-3-phosphate acyltransferase [Synechococcaceae cyanobacterium SM2_3_60]
MREPWPNQIPYHLFKWLCVSPLLHTLYQGRIYGAAQVPHNQPLIVVSNHASNFDPPIVSNCVARPVAFMAKAELFKVPLLKQAIQLYGAYPVQRGRLDRQALEIAKQRLERGWAIGIFLSGTRSRDGRIPHAHQGAALLSAYTQVPLLPVALWGTERIQGSAGPASV